MGDSLTFYAVASVAILLLGLSKGGLAGVGMLAVPIMTLVVPPLQATAIILPILMVQDAVTVWTFRRKFDRRNLGILVPGAAVGILLGYFLAAWVDDAAVKLVIGLISIIFATQRLVDEWRGTPQAGVEGGRAFGWICGAASGFTSMIAHAGGPPFQVYMLPQRLERDTFIGTSVIFFALVNLIKVPPYILLGQVNRESLTTAALLVPVAIATTLLGVRVSRSLSGPVFYRVVYSLLLLMGGKLAWDGGRGLLGLG